ncbi:hypothetical protein PRK78_000018 [Emydomyces testavorans]|uniref:PPPDE domain-containing protein n=1 Tax=Emydomyces testavorans TaxID=2070801 RepID=A0AAF0IFK8_9EURO|nr:hypothetical protein PRK78_000018 [Emydomyces testavorans]
METMELQLIIFNPIVPNQTYTAHWALYLPESADGRKGTMAHLKRDKKLSITGKGPPYLETKVNYTPDESRGIHARLYLPQTKPTTAELRQASQAIYDRYLASEGYDYVNNNCQKFVMDILHELNRLNPDAVPLEAINTAPRKLDDFLRENKKKLKDIFKVDFKFCMAIRD